METHTETKNTHYDHARRHFLGDFPEHLPIEQAYVHIGMYLGWIIDTKLYSAYFEEEAVCQIFRFKRKEISCIILSEIWDGYLGFELLNTPGNHFTNYYYTSGLYRQDYEEVLGKDLPSVYHVHDSWENYEKIKSRINTRFHEWKELKGFLENLN